MSKKIITVPDLHGKTYWKEINPEEYFLINFVGDYCDSYTHTDQEILDNLKEIIELKLKYPEKVNLLTGNHELHYMFPNQGFVCSGYRASMAADLEQIFNEHRNLFDVAFQIENYLWTHAGVSRGWYEWNKETIQEVEKQFEPKNLAETLNMMFRSRYNRELHQVSHLRGGRYHFGGITWADRRETAYDYLEGYHQLVGHTPIDSIEKFGDEKGSIRYTDVLQKVDLFPSLTKFYVFEL